MRCEQCEAKEGGNFEREPLNPDDPPVLFRPLRDDDEENERLALLQENAAQNAPENVQVHAQEDDLLA